MSFVSGRRPWGGAALVLLFALTLSPATATAIGTQPAPADGGVGPAGAGPARTDPATEESPAWEVRRRPTVKGNTRLGRVVRVSEPRWSAEPDTVRRVWLRDGVPIRGATKKQYRITYRDVGSRLAVRFIAQRAGYDQLEVRARAKTVRHRVPVRRVVRYRVETRGRITADLGEFKRLAAQTLADPRGWRGAGVEFRPVKRGGSMTLVLAEASRVPTFSSGCSAEWSCRVGRYVVINQTRWLHASPAWRAGGGKLRNYQHMVVNHESGHFLGRGHRGCPRRGALAPVMQQQSKGLDGCRFNPWPTPSER